MDTSTSEGASIGNPEAAHDLYGLGVRLGFYLQALGMLLYNFAGGTDYGRGLKVASGAITVSVLASWYVFAARSIFSPCEAFIVLQVLAALSYPAEMTLLNPRTILGEIIGLVIMLLADLGSSAALWWTFVRLVNTLPTLGTENLAFFFARVTINGWFRYLVLVICAVDTYTTFQLARKVVCVFDYCGECYTEWRAGNRNGVTFQFYDEDWDKISGILGWDRKKKEDLVNPKYVIRAMSVLVWIYAIVSVELTISWNHLSPSNDLQSPAQLIPLVTGIIVLADSCFVRAYNRVAASFHRFMHLKVINYLRDAPSKVMGGLRKGVGWIDSHGRAILGGIHVLKWIRGRRHRNG